MIGQEGNTNLGGVHHVPKIQDQTLGLEEHLFLTPFRNRSRVVLGDRSLVGVATVVESGGAFDTEWDGTTDNLDPAD